MSYWDSSALAKLYLQEADSAAYRGLSGQLAPVVTAHLTRHELHTVFRRREAEGDLKPGGAAELLNDLDADIASGTIVVQTETESVQQQFAAIIEDCFSATPVVFIRTNDALHIATAKAAGETNFVTADIRQRAAASHVGLSLQP